MDLAEIDALEKATRDDASTLQPLAAALLGPLACSPRKEIRWHVAQLLPRLKLADAGQRRARLALLRGWFDDDPSVIVRVNALQALADLAAANASLRPDLERRIRRALADERPAVRARARLLADRHRSSRSSATRARGAGVKTVRGGAVQRDEP